MQFQVPQFIEVEDKLFGPLTLKQFIYLAGGVGMSAILYFVIPYHFIAIILAVPFVAFSLALAFYQINSKPFVEVLEAAISYYFKNKLYIWKKTPKKAEEKPKEADEEASLDTLFAPRLSESKLKDLAWSLDVTDKLINKRAKQEQSLTFDQEERERVEFQKNYDLGNKSHT
jgi:hypothetical protein